MRSNSPGHPLKTAESPKKSSVFACGCEGRSYAEGVEASSLGLLRGTSGNPRKGWATSTAKSVESPARHGIFNPTPAVGACHDDPG